MTTTTLILLVLLGFFIGILGGTLGIGGGVLMVPLMYFLLRFTHEQAVGTSVAVLLPPIGLFAAMTYYRAGHVNVPIAVVLAITFALGAWLGSYLVSIGWLPTNVLRTMFGLFLIFIATQMLFRGDSSTWAATRTILVVIGAGAAHFAAKIAGRKWEAMTSAPVVYATLRKKPFSTDYEI